MVKEIWFNFINMGEIQKEFLAIWIVVTIITIIPNLISLRKYIRKGEYYIADESLFSFVCLFVWLTFGVITLGVYLAPIIYNIL